MVMGCEVWAYEIDVDIYKNFVVEHLRLIRTDKRCRLFWAPRYLWGDMLSWWPMDTLLKVRYVLRHVLMARYPHVTKRYRQIDWSTERRKRALQTLPLPLRFGRSGVNTTTVKLYYSKTVLHSVVVVKVSTQQKHKKHTWKYILLLLE
jgi:hypothetical protein